MAKILAITLSTLAYLTKARPPLMAPASQARPMVTGAQAMERFRYGEEPVQFVSLPDGRKISYREQGASKEDAKRCLLIQHGLGSSRKAGIPGVSDELLKEFEVRMVAVDRPGTGQSCPHYDQTFLSVCKDMEHVIDSLGMGEKVWLLGYSCGGAYSWAAAYHIPHRIAGLILFCPLGNYWWKAITKEERTEMMKPLSSPGVIVVGRYLPLWLSAWYLRKTVVPRAGQQWLERARAGLSPPDQRHLSELEESGDMMIRDNLESLTKSQGYGMAKDLAIVSSDWGFEIPEIPKKFKGPIHVWQGDDDRLVPLRLQQWIKSQIPDAVDLHVLEGHGHLSWFCFNDKSHRQVLSTAFGPKDGPACI